MQTPIELDGKAQSARTMVREGHGVLPIIISFADAAAARTSAPECCLSKIFEGDMP